MTPDELKAQLIAASWRIDRNPFRDLGCDWYAWLSRDQRQTASDCFCNDKPPSFVLEPCSIELNGNTHSSVTFKLAGQLPDGQWVDLRAYSVAMDKALESIEPAKAVLFAAWEAAHGAAS